MATKTYGGCNRTMEINDEVNGAETTDRPSRVIVSGSPIVFDHIRRLMNTVSDLWIEYKLATLFRVLEDFYGLIMPKLSDKKLIDEIEARREIARNSLLGDKEQVKTIRAVYNTDREAKNAYRNLVYSKARPLLIDYQKVLYKQLYDLKLIIGGDDNERR